MIKQDVGSVSDLAEAAGSNNQKYVLEADILK